MNQEELDKLVDLYKLQRKAFSGFLNNVIDFFKVDNDALYNPEGKFVVHSMKFREKDEAHLRRKILRKVELGCAVTEENLFVEITDFCGVRILHLRQDDFANIHYAISRHVRDQHWQFFEPPKAYTWDPESKGRLEELGLKTEIKDSFYTSVHYVVKPNAASQVTCEIQVRTLFEEIWGETDHDLNYPTLSENVSCREQLKVLAKLVGAGTRLIDSIYSTVSSMRRTLELGCDRPWVKTAEILSGEETETWWVHVAIRNLQAEVASGVKLHLLQLDEEVGPDEIRNVWKGATPIRWERDTKHDKARSITEPIFADLLSLSKNGLLRIHPRDAGAVARTTWNRPVTLRMSIKAVGRDAESNVKRFRIRWDGHWDETLDAISNHLVVE